MTPRQRPCRHAASRPRGNCPATAITPSTACREGQCHCPVGGQAFLIFCLWLVRETGPHRPLVTVTNRTSSTLRKGRCGPTMYWIACGNVAPPCGGGLARPRLPGAVHQCAAAPVGCGEPGQFAALTAREDEVAPGAGPLRAIAVRPQVARPASRALVAAASLSSPHLAHRSPVARRPGRDAPAGGRVSA
jgi:hypothetical protein